MDQILLPRNASYVKVNDFTYIVVSSVCGVLSIVINTVVLFAFYMRKGKQKIVHQYVISMAIADVVFGVIFVPFAILSAHGFPHHRELCIISTSLQTMTPGFTIMALLATVEIQFIGVHFPLFYSMRWSDKITRYHIGSHWILGFLVGAPIIFNANVVSDGTCYFLEVVPKNATLLIVFGMVIPSTCLMILCYLAICIKVKVSTNRFAKLGIFPDNTTTCHLKTSAVIFLNVLLFLVCWLPLYILDTINVFDETFTTNVHIINGLLVLRAVRCAINPFLYAYHIPEVKTRFDCIRHQLMCKNDKKTRSRSISQQTIVTRF